MKITRHLLDGTQVKIDVPDAADLPPETTIGVMRVDGLEIELSLSDATTAEHFLASTGSAVGGSLRLRGGRELRLGHLGGDAGQGTVFVVTLDEQRVFGSVPPDVSHTDLARRLALATWVGRGKDWHARLAAPASWVPERPQTLAQTVRTRSNARYLLDVRAANARTSSPATSGGAKVRGGRLFRSAKSDVRRHVILEASDFISYAIPLPATEIDDVVTSMENVLVVAP